MNLQIDSNAFIGQGTATDLVSFTGNGGHASLTVRTKHTISGPDTSYAVYFNGKIWRESKSMPDAIAGWNELIKREGLESV